jgi:hypothetical protein
MCIGGYTYSYTTGILSSIISSSDNKEAFLKEKIATLNDIKVAFKVDQELYNKLLRNVHYDYRKRSKEFSAFIEDLPMKLKIELLLLMHQSRYSTVEYLREKEKCFIAWVAPLLKPMNFQDSEYIYSQGEEVDYGKFLWITLKVYFIIEGQVGYVLPRYDNQVYNCIK